jgi:hypothetical protein
MKDPKPLFVLFGVVALFFVLTQLIPWQALAMIAFVALMVFALLGHLGQQVAKERRAATPQYQPPQQPSKPEPAPRTNPPIGFDLTPQEYNILAKQYQQGYQAQSPPGSQKGKQPQTYGSTSWSPFTGITHHDLPKEEHSFDYEQPQAQYPKQMPPMA